MRHIKVSLPERFRSNLSAITPILSDGEDEQGHYFVIRLPMDPSGWGIIPALGELERKLWPPDNPNGYFFLASILDLETA